MNKKLYYTLCFISGCLWALIAYLIGNKWMPQAIWGGIFVSPLVGLLVGASYVPAYKTNLIGRIFASLGTLYLAAFLFGLSAGIYDYFQGDEHRNSEVITEALMGTLWGVTFSYLIILWPLAFFNHWMIGRIAKVS